MSIKGGCLLLMCRSAHHSNLIKINLIANVDWGGESIITKISCHSKNHHFHEFYVCSNSKRAGREQSL